MKLRYVNVKGQDDKKVKKKEVTRLRNMHSAYVMHILTILRLISNRKKMLQPLTKIPL